MTMRELQTAALTDRLGLTTSPVREFWYVVVDEHRALLAEATCRKLAELTADVYRASGVICNIETR